MRRIWSIAICATVGAIALTGRAQVDVCWGNTYDVTDDLRTDNVYSQVYVDAAAHESIHIGRPDRAYVLVPSGQTKTVVISAGGSLTLQRYSPTHANVAPMYVYSVAISSADYPAGSMS